MAERTWGAIASGATFEALATTIVFFEDSKASLFGRRGKDGGQDARSGDGKLVYQAKHHQDGSASKAIADAKKEAAKIRTYRQPGHSRYEQWEGVTHWRLVTNATFNPTDRNAWDVEVVPLFASQGLAVDYWERANLDALLDKHRDVDRSFFENETRAFLSLPEVRERMPDQEPFLHRAELGAFFGRDAELASFRQFLASNHLFLLVHGAGGIGKSRLLVEAGEAIASEGGWQVLWANVASMVAGGAWFEAISPERPTLLLVDEPPDDRLLQLLTEQLGGRVGRASQWKVAVAVRSPKDPVLKFLFGPRMKPRVNDLPIAALASTAAEAMCRDLLASGALTHLADEGRFEAARELSRRFSCHPVWLTLAVHVLETRGELSAVPMTARDLASSYLKEVIEAQRDVPPDEVLALLRAMALLGTVTRSDPEQIRAISELTHVADADEVRRRLALLVSRRALVERGANRRLLELKPDVLRDHILTEWLTVDIGYGEQRVVPSSAAKSLAAAALQASISGRLNDAGRAVLVSLARTELQLSVSGNDVPLLDPFFDGIQAALPEIPASGRMSIAGILLHIAQVRPDATCHVITAIRSTVSQGDTVDGVFRQRSLSHADVVLALAWPLFHAALGARTVEARDLILREFCSLAEAEAGLSESMAHGLPNDGKRAAALLERVVEGGPDFWTDFDDAARAVGLSVLFDVASAEPTPAKLTLLKALVQPAVAVRRTTTWSNDRTVTFQTFAISTQAPAWETRRLLLDRIKGILAADQTPLGSRVALWNVIAEAHRSLNQVYRRGDASQSEYLAALLDDLRWTHRVLTARHATVLEIAAARKVWEWHHRFERYESLRAASADLEVLYRSNDLAAEFEPLVSHEDLKQLSVRLQVKAGDLANAQTADEISAFLDRAVAFLGSDSELSELSGVAWALGAHASSRAVVQRFVETALGHQTVTPRTEFGSIVGASWIVQLRSGPSASEAAQVLKSLLARCGGDLQQVNLVLRAFQAVPVNPSASGFPSAEEHAQLRELAPLFLRCSRGPEFVGVLATTLRHEWPQLKALLEDVLQQVPPEQRTPALKALVNGAYWAVHDATPEERLPDAGTWLLERLLQMPDLDDLGDSNEWHLKEAIGRLGRVPLQWLPGVLASRSTLESRAGASEIRAVGHSTRLSKYVSAVDAGTAQDPNTAAAVRSVLDLVSDSGSVGYYLPEVAADIDPDGYLVPAEVSRRLGGASTDEEVRRLARIGGAYEVGTAPWRTIAKAAVVSCPEPKSELRRSVFNALGERGVRSWSGTPGEVPPVFELAVQAARRALESESDSDLRALWEWRLARAEAELRIQEEEAREERGE